MGALAIKVGDIEVGFGAMPFTPESLPEQPSSDDPLFDSSDS